ncbi:MAG: flagellar protein FliS [Defluviitaleaceae bacterium]|nr:flagellar protein FliS [Defluviitaleaceae bacterium]
MIDKSAYMLRISQASPVGLVVINFEIILDYLSEAVTCADSGEVGKDAFRVAVQKAKDGLDQLIQSLDLGVSVSQEFYEIYRYSHKLLCDVHFSSDGEAACSVLKEVSELMETLLEGWKVAAEKADTEAIVSAADENAPKVYAGLTYGKDGSANEYIDENRDRGFMA